MIKNLILTAGVAALVAAASTTAQAQFSFGFESGLGSVTTIGDDLLVTQNDFGAAVPQGSQALLLTTVSSVSDGASASGDDAATIAAAETFLGLDPFILAVDGALGDVSAMKLSLTVAVGDVVSFQYRFFSNAVAGDGEDFAFYTFGLTGETPVVISFADALDASGFSESAYFGGETGIVTVTLPAATTAGTYTLGIGVTDKTDDAVGSGVMVDNIQVTAVPEPASAVLALGAAGLLLARRRRTA